MGNATTLYGDTSPIRSWRESGTSMDYGRRYRAPRQGFGASPWFLITPLAPVPLKAPTAPGPPIDNHLLYRFRNPNPKSIKTKSLIVVP